LREEGLAGVCQGRGHLLGSRRGALVEVGVPLCGLDAPVSHPPALPPSQHPGRRCDPS
jgi:hypothetical protein